MRFGTKKTAKILSHLAMRDAQNILKSIESKNSKLAAEIRDLMITFEDILSLNEKDMPLLHQKIDKNDLLLAMKGASEPLKEKLLAGMSTKRREMMIEELDLMGKVKRKDVEAAQKRIAHVVREMIDKGEISLDEAWIE